MTCRFAFGSWRPSASAASHPPEYQAHEMPLADRVSPIVLSVNGGAGWRAGSARSRLPAGAGAIPLGWWNGCDVLTRKPSGEERPSNTSTGPFSALEGEFGRFFSLPFSICAIAAVGAFGSRGVHAHTSHW